MNVKNVRLDGRPSIKSRFLSEEIEHDYIGGLGIAARLFSEWQTEKAQPLDPQVPLIVSVGPLTATGFPSANRVMFYSISPATNLVSGTWMGGRFGTQLAKTGTLTYMLIGRAVEPSIMVIDDDDLKVIPRPDLWGLTVSRARDQLEREFSGAEIVVIGPAGENQVVFASIRGDEGHAGGRAGLGAVLGSKNLKAIVVRGSKKPVASDVLGFKEYVRLQNKAVRDNGYLADVQGPMGTLNLVQTINEAKGLPTANFRRMKFEDAPELYWSRVSQEYSFRSTTCPNCPVNCRKHVSINGDEYESPEYESLWAFGPNLEVNDFGFITKANHLCNDLGLDTVTTGNIIGMCLERSGEKADTKRILHLIEDVANRTGEGEILARGINHLEEAWGIDYGMHVKGLELPGYHPTRFPGMGLAYATSQRGGCHCRAWTVGDEIFGAPLDEAGLAELVMRYQNAACVRDCLITCVFVDGTFGLPGYAPALTYYTGREYTPESLNSVGERIFNLERLMNIKQGVFSTRDVLPKRFMMGAQGEAFAVSKVEYNHLRGWNNEGYPTLNKLAELKLI